MKPISKPTKRMVRWLKDLNQIDAYLQTNQTDDALVILHRVILEMDGSSFTPPPK